MFETYKLELFDTTTPLCCCATATEEQKRFYLIFVFIDKHPLQKDFTAVLRINGEADGATPYWYNSKCLPVARKLSVVLHEIHFEDRLDPFNHSRYFSERITHILDALPIRLCSSSLSLLNNLTWNPKYGGPVLKLTIGCTFTAIPVAFSINLGLPSDGVIAVNAEGSQWPEREWWEWAMGDGPYESMERVAVKFRPMPIPGSHPLRYRPLTRDQIQDNLVFDQERGRIEHVNAQFVSHALFNERPYRGNFHDLVAYIRITMHALTAQIRDFEPTRQRSGFGPFPHYTPTF
jgi:hypothetical protein